VAGGHTAGGSHGLAGLIEDHGEEIYADLLETYGVNLVDLFGDNPVYSPRQVLVMIQQLPPVSRTVAALRGGDIYLGWGADRYMLASLIDAVQQVGYATIAANSGKKKPKAPKPFPRPEAIAKRRENNPFRRKLEQAKEASR
jgi:hypothetical protein